jgi:serine protease Do/serine protease DegQ
VRAASPAEKAGLRDRDVIVAMNGHPVRSASELRARLGLTPIGEEVELRVNRGTESRTVRAQIAAPQEVAGGEGRPVPQLPGMSVVEIERGSVLYQRLHGGGLVVSAIEPGSRAFQAGFRSGDIIYAVNRQRVQTLAQLQAALQGVERGDSVAVSLLRGDFNVTITMR